MATRALLSWSITAVAAASSSADGPGLIEPIVSADVSSLNRAHDGGITFTTFRGPVSLADALADAGYNTVRLRLWVDPIEPYTGLADVLDVAAECHDAGLDIWLNFHYSDTWADPGQQTKPAAWADLGFPALNEQLYNYTRAVLETFEASSIPLTHVQLGNEIQNGMLWPDGQIFGGGSPQWAPFIELVASARQAVDDAEIAQTPLVIVHPGGDSLGFFFDEIESRGVDYDIAGLSYYSWFHGQLDVLESGLGAMAGATAKPVMVAETAYPWTLGFGDSRGNRIGPSNWPDDLISSYFPSPNGQAEYLEAVWDRVHAVGDDRGLGVSYWEPAQVPGIVEDSSRENLALFDFNAVAQPGLERYAAAATPIDGRHVGQDAAYAQPVAEQARVPASPLVDQLDALFLTQRSGGLHIGITGNLEDRGGALVVLLDLDPQGTQGQQVLDLPAGLPAGIPILDDMVLDPGFKPDLALAFNTWNGTMFVDRIDLGPSTQTTFLGSVVVGAGESALINGTNPHGIVVAHDNGNTAGIGSSCGAPASATTGLEVFIPRGALASPLDQHAGIGVLTLILKREGVMTDQWLPPLPSNVTAPFAVSSAIDLTTFPGTQHTVFDLSPANRRAQAVADADVNDDGVRTADDVVTFLEYFNAGRPVTDVTGDGQLDVFDVAAFSSLLAGGC
ncbi:MAG: glycosyl hydrolase 53 family protein [Planctomycetota bacterium]